ncbi:Ldh family oxidoreductase [Thalassococcus profundi]|uniref:Ldh family oxidoreductase n=1 Tax=Thalassococcus profundi TaxID=2282382 RepID=A0A369TFK9_9RHOB|nr:Ldh family oxidoreductase [Thalassococcus profundi]RDD64161.1 Ldh family oxidoreductase [Thalassococcus profundi]
MPLLSVAQIEELSAQALSGHGAADWVAAEMARAIAWAEARENRICGLYYLESYCQQLRTGRVRGDAEPQVDRPRPSEITVHAGDGFAQPAFTRALDTAVAAARETGIASVAIHHAHTCTALGYFTEAAARAGVAALGMTNASPIVAPPGGRSRVIGTNPISFAAPDGQGGVGMLFDQSTTTVALGHITMARAARRPIPEGWALDAQGRPTTDPEAALQGTLTSAGGYKGWGFGLMAELLVTGLCGSLPSRAVAPLKAPEGAPHRLGQYFVLIDPRQSNQFQTALADLGAAVTAEEGTRIPGRGKTPLQEVEVPASLYQHLTDLAAR